MKRDALCHAVRQTLVRLPPPHDSHYGVVPEPPPEGAIKVHDLVGKRDAERALAEIHVLAGQTPDPSILSKVIIQLEALASSAMEGTHSTLQEVLAQLVTQDDRASNPATRQVAAYAEALSRLVQRATAIGPTLFTLELLSELHEAVMKDDPAYADKPGALRTQTVWIGGKEISHSTWNPPPSDRVPACISENIAYMRYDSKQIPTQGTLTRLAIAHAHFEAVHPFRDGNGRVGRLLLPIMMAAYGEVPLYLSPYIDKNKDRYIAALKAAQQQLDWGAMIDFLSQAVVATVAELKITRQALLDLYDIWKGRRIFRAGSAALRALDHLLIYPMFSINTLSLQLNISVQAANLAAQQLLEVGIIVERDGKRRNRLFGVPEAMTIIGRPFGEEPVLPEQ